MWLALDLVTRLVIGGSLILGGVAKTASTVAWRQLWLAAYRLLPRWLVRPVALLLPPAEIACGLAMLTGILGTASAAASAIMLAVLATAVTTALVRQLDISCHCLSMVGEPISWHGVLRNLGLMASAVLVAWHGGAELIGSTGLSAKIQLPGLALAVLGVSAGCRAARAIWLRRVLAAVAARPAMPVPGE